MEKEEAEEKEASRKAEKERYKMKYKVGDKVRVIKATSGCMGAEGSIGVVTDKKNTDGLLDYRNGFNIELKNGKIWRIGFESVCEPVEDELTAEEAIRLKCEMCESISCSECKFSRSNNGEDIFCNKFLEKYPEQVVEILKQWKKDHEKKEVEVTQKIYCLVVDEERKVVHEEEIGNSDSCMDVLKNYCENHDGKFFSIMEFRYEVKQ
ncbi:Uncharacterised protein [[Ruminococcus] torques]|nr:Uncharacterised protein [[Ruminococcus] torques]